MFNFFAPPAKKHPVVEAAEKLVAERSPDAIAAYDVVASEANIQLDERMRQAKEEREEAIAKAHATENEKVGQAITISTEKKASALRSAVDRIFSGN